MDIKLLSPQDDLDFSVTFDELLPLGDTIATQTWTLPSGIAKGSDLGPGLRISTAYLHCTTAVGGEYHTIHCDIVSVGGLKKRQSFVLKIVEA